MLYPFVSTTFFLMVKLFFQVITCTNKNLIQISVKPPVENTSEAEVLSEAKSLKSLSADSKLDRVESYGRERCNGKDLEGNDVFYLNQLT